MADNLVVFDFSTFFVTGGDVERRDEANGFFFADMRHLSAWHIILNGQPMRLLTMRVPDYYSARIFGTRATARIGVNPTVSKRRDRFVSDGVHEDLVVENNNECDQPLRVEVRFQADFAESFEVKGKATEAWTETGGAGHEPGHSRLRARRFLASHDCCLQPAMRSR